MSKSNHTAGNVVAGVVIVAFLYSQNVVPATAKNVVSNLASSKGELANPVPGAPRTSSFGMRFDPVAKKKQLHAGQDFGVPSGTPIHAAADGVVSVITSSGASGGYGNYTCIQHSGDLSTCYGHQSKFMVSKGNKVTRGQVIGLSGSTGYSTGPHLHFEVRVKGKPVNPSGYL